MTSADLIRELQESRPTAGEALRDRVRELAARAPERRTTWHTRFSTRRTALVALPVAATVAVAAAGVGGLTRSSAPPRVPESLAQEAVTRSKVDAAASLRAGAPATDTATATAPTPSPGRAQRYTAQLTVAVKDTSALSQATQRALATARELGGYVVTISYASSETGTASMTLRVPTAKVQDALVRLSSLGQILSQQVQIDDLQGQIDELTKRENALRERIARLSARLAEPGLDAQTRAVLEARRDAARSELASVRTSRSQVSGDARYATVQLSLQTEKQSVSPATSSRFDRALDEAVKILALEAVAVLYALVIAGPLAVVAGGLWLAWRIARRREAERLLTS